MRTITKINVPVGRAVRRPRYGITVALVLAAIVLALSVGRFVVAPAIFAAKRPRVAAPPVAEGEPRSSSPEIAVAAPGETLVDITVAKPGSTSARREWVDNEPSTERRSGKKSAKKSAKKSVRKSTATVRRPKRLETPEDAVFHAPRDVPSFADPGRDPDERERDDDGADDGYNR